MSNIKYPRTYHLPFSPGTTKDDKKLQGNWFSYYKDKEIIVSEKLDGENTTLCQEEMKIYMNALRKYRIFGNE